MKYESQLSIRSKIFSNTWVQKNHSSSRWLWFEIAGLKKVNLTLPGIYLTQIFQMHYFYEKEKKFKILLECGNS